MKIIGFIAFILFAVSAAAVTKDELINQILDRNKQQREENERGIATLQMANSLLKQQGVTLTVAQEQVNKVEKERKGWHDYAMDQHEKLMNAEKRVVEKEAARFKWMAYFIGLAMLNVAYFGLKFFTPLRAIL